MTKRKSIKVADLAEFDAAPYLDSEAAIAAYLTDILEMNDAALLASALGDIARSRGMTEIAKAAGVTREALYKALRRNSEPRFRYRQSGMRRTRRALSSPASVCLTAEIPRVWA